MPKLKVEVPHGCKEIVYDNLGHGWRIECLCGFVTSAWVTVEGAGSDIDDHFKATESVK